MNSISIDVEDTKSSDLVDGEDEDDISKFSEKGKKTSTSKTITIKQVEYITVIKGINNAIQKALKNRNIKPADYNYKKIIAAGKKVSIIIVIGDDSTNEKTKSNDSSASDEERNQRILSNSKKKRKSRATQENDLSKEEQTRAGIM
ncbi:hypothetical protein RhiirA4_479186 [Rhizophagus irregularis]|uniref:Uncharacterized protein n=1 Tax=Rhizophagus irregularis TaxID=588596 RepID=A0A2I1HG72_9GLOM|nr:hypothetical protein RhiirA4_479186 [Rhizophagus irregularis]